MIMIKPSEKHLKILQFDGQVFELFTPYQNGNHRIHIGLLQSVQINMDRRGNHTLVIHWSGDPISDVQIDEPQLAKMTELVSALQQAVAALQL